MSCPWAASGQARSGPENDDGGGPFGRAAIVPTSRSGGGDPGLPLGFVVGHPLGAGILVRHVLVRDVVRDRVLVLGRPLEVLDQLRGLRRLVLEVLADDLVE